MKEHLYSIELQWTGNMGEGTSSYSSYQRNYNIQSIGKPVLLGSSDPIFRGDTERYNPEELLVAALSSCHMLWFLHLCSASGVVVTDYHDSPQGVMQMTPDGSGQFSSVYLQPLVTVANTGMLPQLEELHKRANTMCFIAKSVNFPIEHRATAQVTP